MKLVVVGIIILMVILLLKNRTKDIKKNNINKYSNEYKDKDSKFKSFLNTINENKNIIIAISVGIGIIIGMTIYAIQFSSCMDGYSDSTTIMDYSDGKVNFTDVDSFMANHCKKYEGLTYGYALKTVIIYTLISFIVVSLIWHIKPFKKLKKEMLYKILMILALLLVTGIIVVVLINNNIQKQSEEDAYYGKFSEDDFCTEKVKKYDYSNSYVCNEKKEITIIIKKDNSCFLSIGEIGNAKEYKCNFILNKDTSEDELTINIENSNNEVPKKLICDYLSTYIYCKSDDSNFNYSDSLFKYYYDE